MQLYLRGFDARMQGLGIYGWGNAYFVQKGLDDESLDVLLVLFSTTTESWIVTYQMLS